MNTMSAALLLNLLLLVQTPEPRAIELAWQHPAPERVVEYIVERSQDESSWPEIGRTTALTFQDVLSPGTGSWFYRVKARGEWATSDPSESVRVDTDAPALPHGLTIRVVIEVRQ